MMHKSQTAFDFSVIEIYFLENLRFSVGWTWPFVLELSRTTMSLLD